MHITQLQYITIKKYRISDLFLHGVILYTGKKTLLLGFNAYISKLLKLMIFNFFTPILDCSCGGIYSNTANIAMIRC